MVKQVLKSSQVHREAAEQSKQIDNVFKSLEKDEFVGESFIFHGLRLNNIIFTA